MPDFMRDDIGLGEITRRAESPIELAEERQIEIHLLIARAIERSARGRSRSARRSHGVLEEDQDRFAILASRRREHAPQVSSVSASTTAMNSAAGSLEGAPVGALWVCWALTSSAICSSVERVRSRQTRHREHDATACRCRRRRLCRRSGPGGPQCWYCDVHLPISWPNDMPEPGHRRLSWLACEQGPSA